MKVKRFAQISVDISDKKELRQVSSNTERYLYMVLYTNPYANYIGLFKVHFNMLSYSLDCDEHQLLKSLTELKQVCLIDFDKHSEFVRIVGYFDKINHPANVSVVKAMRNDFYELEECSEGLFMPAAVSFCYSTKLVSRDWKTRSEAMDLIEDFEYILEERDEALFKQELAMQKKYWNILGLRSGKILQEDRDDGHCADTMSPYNKRQDDRTLEDNIFKQN